MDNTVKECPLKGFGCKWQGSADVLKNEHWKTCAFLGRKNNVCSLKLFAVILICLFLYFLVLWAQTRIFEESNISISSKDELIQSLSAIKEEIKNRDLYFNNWGIRLEIATNSQARPFDGIFVNISTSYLIRNGFILGLNISLDNFSPEKMSPISFKYKDLVMLGVKRKGSSDLILAALGKGSIIFTETNYRESCTYNNHVCWYYNNGRSFGFSYYKNIYLDDIDIASHYRKYYDYRLSVSLNGTTVCRIGDIIASKQNNNLQEYELMILYKNN